MRQHHLPYILVNGLGEHGPSHSCSPARNQYVIDLDALIRTPIFIPVAPEGIVHEGMPAALVYMIGDYLDTPIIAIDL